MSQKTVKIYLSDYHYKRASQSKHKYLNGIGKALEKHGFQTSYSKILPDTKYTAGIIEDYAILDKLLIGRHNTFTLRRSIFVPFWTVERSEYRADMRLFNKAFSADNITPEEAENFASQLRRKHLGTAERIPPQGEVIFVPLQGRLDKKRKGQTMSPIDMIRTIRQYEPNREIFVKLHPRQKYKESELDALNQTLKDTGAQHFEDDSKTLFPKTKYLATMNSSMGFEALTFGLPALLFADADFHHVTVNMSEYIKKPQEAFDAIHNQNNNFDQYVTWYLRDNMVHAGQRDAIERSFNYLRQLGMDIPE